MEMEENILVDPRAASEALRQGLAQGSSFIERLEKITMMEVNSDDEDLVSRCFEKLSKAVSKGESNVSTIKLSDLSQYGFSPKYVKKIGFCVIRLESHSPTSQSKKTKSTRRPNRSVPLEISDDSNYQEDDFEDYDESDSNALTDVILAKPGNRSRQGKSGGNDHSSPQELSRKEVITLPSPTRSSSQSTKRGGKSTAWIAEDNWRLGDQIGSGSFGEVFQGMNDKGKLFAVKRLKLSGQAELINLVEEIDLMRRLTHQNIVEYLGAKVDRKQGFIYIFQAWVPGGSVAHLLKRFGPFQAEVVRRYTRQILWGLQYLHAHNIVHRDIKGGNILVDDDGRVKLADFGASTVIEFGETQETATIKGTPYFMAPEVLSQSKYGRKGDIWAVGCTIIQMLTGDPPWKEHKLQGLVQLHLLLSTWEGLPPFNTDIPDALRACMELCFEKNPDERPTAVELLKCEFLSSDSDGLEDSMDIVPDNASPTDSLSRAGSFDETENDGMDNTMADLRKQIELVEARDKNRWKSGEDTYEEIEAQIARRQDKHAYAQGGSASGSSTTPRRTEERDRDRERDRGEARPVSRLRSKDTSPDRSRVPSREPDRSDTPEVVSNPYARRTGTSNGRGGDRVRRPEQSSALETPKLPVVRRASPRAHTRSESMQQGSARDSEDDNFAAAAAVAVRPSSGGIADSPVEEEGARSRHQHRKDRDRLSIDEDQGVPSSSFAVREERTPRSGHSGVFLSPRAAELAAPISSSSPGASEGSRAKQSELAFSTSRSSHGHSHKDEVDDVSPRSDLGARKERTGKERDRGSGRDVDSAEDAPPRSARASNVEHLPSLSAPQTQVRRGSSPVTSSRRGSSPSGSISGIHGLLAQSQHRRKTSADEVLVATEHSEAMVEETWKCEHCGNVNVAGKKEDEDYCLQCAKRRVTMIRRESASVKESKGGKHGVHEAQARVRESRSGFTTVTNSAVNSAAVSMDLDRATWDCKYCGETNNEDPDVNYCIFCAKFRPEDLGMDVLKSRVSRAPKTAHSHTKH